MELEVRGPDKSAANQLIRFRGTKSPRRRSATPGGDGHGCPVKNIMCVGLLSLFILLTAPVDQDAVIL